MKWRNFKTKELVCKCGCGQFNPHPEFITLMDRIQVLRDICGFPFVITSAYRCENHPDERNKEKAGQHNLAAVDIAVSYEKAHILLKHAIALGFTGIGINQKGKDRFIHLDLRPTPTIWSY